MKHPGCRVLHLWGAAALKITGLKELERKMKQLSDVARKEAKQEALYAGAQKVLTDAVSLTIVGQYGANAGTYGSGPMRGQKRVGGNLRSGNDYEVDKEDATIFNSVKYARKVEFGVNRHGEKGAFLRPALDNNKDNIIKIFSDVYKKYLTR